MDADARQSRIVADVQRSGFEIDWRKVLDVGDASDPLRSIERLLIDDMRREKFGETVAVLGVNGKLLSSFVQLETEKLAGMRAEVNLIPLEFKEPDLALPEGSIEYWKRVLGLSDRQTDEVRRWLEGFDAQARAIRGRTSDALMKRLAKLYSEALAKEEGVAAFLKRAREIVPNESVAILETEYRTHLSRVYGEDRHEQIVSRSNAFPFTQVFAIIDSVTTWNICLPLGTAGPGGKGYICASTDRFWFKWKFPAHWRCRTQASPMGYRECQRLGILAADGKTKIAIVGSNPDRPFGDPPAFAADPVTGELRRVEPAPGFGS